MLYKMCEKSSDISSKEIGFEIAKDLLQLIKDHDEVEISLENIEIITTNCSKIIFGTIYLELGAEQFYKKIRITQADDEMKIIIQQGIKNAISEN
ncbi:STAS-like domain-containing protein [Spirochaeta isovalerica]|uniref:DUF4325 domain-containing protein n=1 Tax=Spirochaeta isovalerica TaxID=150 RepID=A0A841RHR2_9SPIO|nr:DUF4325 domain-containing protein [Spirochaeta isovalerica]MBB6482707.1 hypothetical protein [Spirochaeta isovalerica]